MKVALDKKCLGYDASRLAIPTVPSRQLEALYKAWRDASDFERQQFVVTFHGDLLAVIEACNRMMKLPAGVMREADKTP